MDSKTILICDDDPTVRSSLSLVLKRAGYGIATAETPEQAVAQIRTTIPGLILMDMNYTRSTTGEEGLELLAKVKVLAPEVPVILITAWGSIHLAVQGIRSVRFHHQAVEQSRTVGIDPYRDPGTGEQHGSGCRSEKSVPAGQDHRQVPALGAGPANGIAHRLHPCSRADYRRKRCRERGFSADYPCQQFPETRQLHCSELRRYP